MQRKLLAYLAIALAAGFIVTSIMSGSAIGNSSRGTNAWFDPSESQRAFTAQ
jgi:hypothetical protein